MAYKLGLPMFDPVGLKNWSLQGELCGPSIQKNKMGFSKPTFRAYNLFDIDAGTYLNHDQLVDFCFLLDIPVVPVVFDGVVDPSWGVEDFLTFASKQNYDNGTPAEGIVWRPVIEQQSSVLPCGRLSFKTISNRFLDTYKDE